MITIATVRKFRTALNEFLDAFEADLGPQPTTVVPTAPVPARAKAAPTRREPVTLPASLAQPKAGTVLSDETRAENLPEATKHALKILKVIGDGPQLVSGVTGTLALEHIPYDAVLVQMAIDAARAEL